MLQRCRCLVVLQARHSRQKAVLGISSRSHVRASSNHSVAARPHRELYRASRVNEGAQPFTCTHSSSAKGKCRYRPAFQPRLSDKQGNVERIVCFLQGQPILWHSSFLSPCRPFIHCHGHSPISIYFPVSFYFIFQPAHLCLTCSLEKWLIPPAGPHLHCTNLEHFVRADATVNPNKLAQHRSDSAIST